MTDRLLWCLYSALALAATTNQETSVAAHDLRKFQTKLQSKHSHWYQPRNFHL